MSQSTSTTTPDTVVPATIIDPVSDQTSGSDEIGYTKADHPNCSQTLWQNLTRNPDKAAVVGPLGTLTYRELIAQAARWGNAFIAAGLQRGERIAFFLDDTPPSPPPFMVLCGQALCLYY